MSCECCETFSDAVLGAVGIYRRQGERTNAADKLKWFDSKKSFAYFKFRLVGGGSEDILCELQYDNYRQRVWNPVTFNKIRCLKDRVPYNSVIRLQDFAVARFLSLKGRG